MKSLSKTDEAKIRAFIGNGGLATLYNIAQLVDEDPISVACRILWRGIEERQRLLKLSLEREDS